MNTSLIKTLGIIILLIISKSLHAQNIAVRDNVAKHTLSNDLKLDQITADKLSSIMTLSDKKIFLLLINKELTPIERNKLIMPIIAQRENDIKYLLDPEEQERLKLATLNYFGEKRRWYLMQMNLQHEKDRELLLDKNGVIKKNKVDLP